MRDNSTSSREETGERESKSGVYDFHSVNKPVHAVNNPYQKKTTTYDDSATATFITLLSLGCVDVVSKAGLAMGVTPPIRSIERISRREPSLTLYSRCENPDSVLPFSERPFWRENGRISRRTGDESTTVPDPLVRHEFGGGRGR